MALAALSLILALGRCGPEELPDPNSTAYREAVRSFYRGVAAVQAGEEVGARASFERVTDLAPAEPAAWANLGVLALRRNEFEQAAEHLQRAHELAPENDHIQMLLGFLEAAQGRFDSATSRFEAAYAQNPSNLKAAYALSQELERQASPARVQQALSLIRELRQAHPDNLAVTLEEMRLALKLGQTDSALEVSRILEETAANWPEDVRGQLTAFQSDLQAGDQRSASTSLAFLRNLLLQLPSYRTNLAEIQTPVEEPGDYVAHFIRLPPPLPHPDPADTLLTFEREPIAISEPGAVYAGFFHPSSTSLPTSVVAAGENLKFAFGELLQGHGITARSVHPVAAFDFNYDYQADLAVAGEGGVRLFAGDSLAGFVDVTHRMGLPGAVLTRPYVGVWTFDADLDGDLDLLLSPADDEPLTLRNNGDGTFAELRPLRGITGIRAFSYADLDQDGDPDAAVVDEAGDVVVFVNDRGGIFRAQAFDVGSPAETISVADLDGDGAFELLALRSDGAVVRVGESVEVLLSGTLPASQSQASHLYVADVDNNGSLDLAVARGGQSALYLSSDPGRLDALAIEIAGRLTALADEDGDGRLDLLVLREDGVEIHRNASVAPYFAQVIRPRAAQALGDQRINSFGIGGQIDIRSGLLFQKQVITEPVVHFGLGERPGTDVARVVWPNGDVQAEFDLAADQGLPTQQRLKGSCPWLFAYDGTGMTFVTDFIWRSPLGLAINAQEAAGVLLTEDRVKIRGDQLVPRDGLYDVRITAELWETHFFDHISLLAVDHPEGTEVFVDERFAVPPPDLSPRLTSRVTPVARAVDYVGRDVTDLIRARDARYLGNFEKGSYQGVAQDHHVEIYLGDALPLDRPLLLVANGWVRPTDSSINIALSQGSSARPRDLSMDVLDDDDTWQELESGMGFPAGKTKTILLPLDDAVRTYTSRTIRLRTNLEIYWDAFGWVAVHDDDPDALEIRRVPRDRAALRYRGYSEIRTADEASPEIPVYENIQGTIRRWFDLEGYYTRFGEVGPLLEKVDDRYVIMNAGDEILLSFEALPDPGSGVVRDFILVGDGWVKDGDYNTAHSRTVAPLPLHEDTAYDRPLRPLQNDDAYRRHPQDWREYHTRYVTPERFTQALAPIP